MSSPKGLEAAGLELLYDQRCQLLLAVHRLDASVRVPAPVRVSGQGGQDHQSVGHGMAGLVQASQGACPGRKSSSVKQPANQDQIAFSGCRHIDVN
jgi:hypothetical protein